jgi:serine protease Do
MTFSFSSEGGAYLGIQPEDITRENMSQYNASVGRGVGISRVSENGPAEKAGLKKGDVILQFDGEPVATSRKLLRLIGESAPEQSVRLTISRNGSEQQLTVTLGKREDQFRAYRSMIPEGRGGVIVPRQPGMTPQPRVWGNAPENFTMFFGNNRRVGITTMSLTKQLGDFLGVANGQGLLISSVSENSPASKAGLRAGDVITEVDGQKIEDSGDFINALNRKEEGDVTLTIIRDKSQRTIKVTPERRQTTPGVTIPAYNIAPMVSRVRSLPMLVEMPDVRGMLQRLPRIEAMTLPRINTFMLPRMQSLPRIHSLPSTTQFFYF